MNRILTTHFVDGSDVEFAYSFYRRRVEVSAYDEKTRRRYRLSFDSCTRLDVAYSQDVEDGFRDLSNLTEGISELTGEEPGLRGFEIGFADGTVVKIWCKQFSMVEVDV